MYADLNRWLREARVYEVREPKPGFRHQERTNLIPHRFPIKNGLTFQQALLWQNGPNPLLRLVRRVEPSTAKPTSGN